MAGTVVGNWGSLCVWGLYLGFLMEQENLGPNLGSNSVESRIGGVWVLASRC